MSDTRIHQHPVDLKKDIDPFELGQELQKVYEKEEEVNAKVRPLLANYDASPDEAIEWWRANDPIQETTAQKLYHGTHNLSSSEWEKTTVSSIERGMFGLNASLTVLAGFAYPQLFKDTAKGWTDRLAQNVPSENQDFIREGRLDVLMSQVGTDVLVKMSKMLNQDMPIDAEELEKLSIGREILNDTSNFIRKGVTKGYIVFDGSTEGEVGETLALLDYFGGTIHSFLSDFANIAEPEGHEDAEALQQADSARMLGLYNSTLQVAEVESHTSDKLKKQDILWKESRDSPELRRELLGRLLFDLNWAFGSDEHTTISQRLKANKGALHETMWFLDTVMMRHMWPGRYDDIVVWPANHNSDKPVVGHPEHYRGYDFMLRKPGRNRDSEVVDFVQVKSSPQAGKPHEKIYHPIIWPYEENPFKELQANRLRAKLRVYQDIFDRGFNKADISLLEEYLMVTPRQAMNNIWLRTHDRTWEMEQILMKNKIPNLFGVPTPQFVSREPNRAERRAAERSKRKIPKHVMPLVDTKTSRT